MTALRLIPLRNMAVVALLGCALPKLLHIELPSITGPLSGITISLPFALYFLLWWAIFLAQAGAFTFYSVFIYPFFLSPFRHLPTPKGGLPILGHGNLLRTQGPGPLAKEW